MNKKMVMLAFGVAVIVGVNVWLGLKDNGEVQESPVIYESSENSVIETIEEEYESSETIDSTVDSEAAEFSSVKENETSNAENRVFVKQFLEAYGNYEDLTDRAAAVKSFVSDELYKTDFEVPETGYINEIEPVTLSVINIFENMNEWEGQQQFYIAEVIQVFGSESICEYISVKVENVSGKLAVVDFRVHRVSDFEW